MHTFLLVVSVDGSLLTAYCFDGLFPLEWTLTLIERGRGLNIRKGQLYDVLNQPSYVNMKITVRNNS